jgi:hypothetical protein
MHNLNAVHKVVAFRNKELHATMTAIRDQKRLMASEIRSGSFYGDERPTPIRPGEDDGGGVSAEELAELLSDDGPVENSSLPQLDVESQVAPLSVEGDEDDVLGFLESDNQAAASHAEATDTHDLDELLENV